jgi:hypothetical protein
VSDINTAVVDSLKVLDLKRPIREADMAGFCREMTRSRMTLRVIGRALRQ